MHLLLAVGSLLLATPGNVRVSASGCSNLDLAELRRLLQIELQGRSDMGVADVLVSCDEQVATVQSMLESSVQTTSVSLEQLPAVALPRTLALTAAEMLFAMVERKKTSQISVPDVKRVLPEVKDQTEPSVAPEGRWWMTLSGGGEYGGQLLGGGRLGLRTSLWRQLALEIDFSWVRVERPTSLGVIQSNAVDGVAALIWVAEAGRWRFPVGIGVKAGAALLLGIGNADDIVSGSVRAARVGPVSLAGVWWWPLPWFSLGLDLQVGWLFGGARGTVEGLSPVVLSGLNVAAFAGMGVRF